MPIFVSIVTSKLYQIILILAVSFGVYLQLVLKFVLFFLVIYFMLLPVLAIKSHCYVTNWLSDWILAVVSVLNLLLLQPDVRQPIFEPIKIRSVKRLIAPSGEEAEDKPAGGQTPRQRDEQDLCPNYYNNIESLIFRTAKTDHKSIDRFGCFIT